MDVDIVVHVSHTHRNWKSMSLQTGCAEMMGWFEMSKDIAE